MNPALVAALVMLAVLAAVFVLASYPGGSPGWAARLGGRTRHALGQAHLAG